MKNKSIKPIYLMASIWIFLFANGCVKKISDCADKAFSEKFISSLDYIKNTEAEGVFYSEKRLEAITFLSVVTGKESLINDPHHPYYPNSEDFKLDLNNWEEWYKSNKCRFTIGEADSLIRLYNSGKLKLK